MWSYEYRNNANGEVANQPVHLPGILPKFPGRFYYYFGKPIETEGTTIDFFFFSTWFVQSLVNWFELGILNCEGMKQKLRDREKSHELYLQVKSEVERCIAYLKEKRERDPYRNILARLVYQATNGFTAEVPTFEIWSFLYTGSPQLLPSPFGVDMKPLQLFINLLILSS